MAAISLSPELIEEYETLFNSCVVSPGRQGEVEQLSNAVLQHRQRYQSVAEATGVPWYFIAAIHNMEAGRNFNCHLHNGDPLSARTVHVPAGRPKSGAPPFTWEESARDALGMRGLNAACDWSLAGILYQLEAYNGWGYRLRHPETLTPYLWSCSNHYHSGKFVADGRWSATAVSKQCGAAVLLRRMAELGEITLYDQAPPETEHLPLVSRYAASRPESASEIAKALALQKWLNTFAPIFVKEDGHPGRKTSDAYRRVTGRYLPGDQREEET